MEEYIRTCNECQSKAIHRHKPYGQLEPLPVPTNPTTAPFKEISLNWITELPEAEKGNQTFNAILTIVDRVTKYALFIPIRNDTTAADFAELFFEHVETRFGTPISIIINKDSYITFDF